MNLQFDIQINSPVILYSLSGKITSDTDYEVLEKEVFDHLNRNYFRIIFNLEELTHTNSSGISFFMRTLTKARIMGGDLILLNIFGNVKKIFEIAKLNEVYTICENQAEALNHFKEIQ
ncbi:MAG: STAS domain-containing protein [Crocinitomicaceae bacterium]|nr:STAS domain-containing protein [Crocinitomicaceae bacterium]